MLLKLFSFICSLNPSCIHLYIGADLLDDSMIQWFNQQSNHAYYLFMKIKVSGDMIYNIIIILNSFTANPVNVMF